MIFPELRFEKEVIEKDKTRIEASGTYISGTEFPISSVKIKVSDYVDQEVFVLSKPEQWILDMSLKFQADIDSSNNLLKFNEDGVELVATLTADTYLLVDLVTEIQTQMNAVSAVTYTLTLQEDQTILIEWPTGNRVQLLNRKSRLWEDLGFKDTLYSEVISSTKLIGAPVRTLPVKLQCEVVTTEALPGVGTNTVTTAEFLKVYSLDTVRLLSDDSELEIHEPDVKRFTKKGRNTHKNAHLQAQKDIIEWLDRKGYVNLYMEKFTINDIYDPSEVSNWSKFRALEIIYGGLSNAKDDIFREKEKKYMKLANQARRRIIRIDLDKDGRAYYDEFLLTDSIKMVRV